MVYIIVYGRIDNAEHEHERKITKFIARVTATIANAKSGIEMRPIALSARTSGKNKKPMWSISMAIAAIIFIALAFRKRTFISYAVFTFKFR